MMRATRTAIIAMTTSSSIRVNAARDRRQPILLRIRVPSGIWRSDNLSARQLPLQTRVHDPIHRCHRACSLSVDRFPTSAMHRPIDLRAFEPDYSTIVRDFRRKDQPCAAITVASRASRTARPTWAVPAFPPDRECGASRARAHAGPRP